MLLLLLQAYIVIYYLLLNLLLLQNGQPNLGMYFWPQLHVGYFLCTKQLVSILTIVECCFTYSFLSYGFKTTISSNLIPIVLIVLMLFK